MQVPLILAIDTSNGPCTVAVARGLEVLAHARMDEYQQQSRLLMGIIDDACKQAGITPGELDAVACTLGPGNFTSVRIGLAAAKGLAVALDKKLIGLSSLEVIAYGAAQENKDNRDILVLLNAHRGEVYAQCFSPDGKAQTGAAAALTLAQLAQTYQNRALLVAGNAWDIAAPLLKSALRAETASHPDARWLAALATKAYSASSPVPVNPIYIRPPDAKLPANPV